MRPPTLVFALPLLLLTAACAVERLSGPEQGQTASIVLRADVSGTPIATLVATVTAPDIATSIVYNLTMANGTASATLTVPPGQHRTITVRAFASNGVITHIGGATIDVNPGLNPPVLIVLRPVTGDVPIIVTP